MSFFGILSLGETTIRFLKNQNASPDSSGNPCGALILPHKIETIAGLAPKKKSSTTFVIEDVFIDAVCFLLLYSGCYSFTITHSPVVKRLSAFLYFIVSVFPVATCLMVTLSLRLIFGMSRTIVSVT